MAGEENKALVRRFHEELWNKKNAHIADELCSASYVGYLSGLPEPLRGPQGLKQAASVFYTAFPDLRFMDEDTVAEADRVAVRWTALGTHTGPLMGPGGSISPTGKKVKMEGTGFLRIQGGRIVEQRTLFDQFGLLQQLGVIPAPAQAGGKHQ